MPNSFCSISMSPAERLDEVATSGFGFLRLRARRQREKGNEPNHLRKFGLHFGANEACVTPTSTPTESAHVADDGIDLPASISRISRCNAGRSSVPPLSRPSSYLSSSASQPS